MDKVLSGKPVAQAIREAITARTAALSSVPKMALIQLGNDPASAYYVQNIVKTGAKLGCEVILHSLPDDTTQTALLQMISELNLNPAVHGIMLQKPLPPQIDEKAINLAIAPAKDIDGIHPANLGKIITEDPTFFPCTAAAVVELMRFYGIDPAGKEVVIIGRSAVVGKPLANMLLAKHAMGNATVTVCHSRTANLQAVASRADILIAAIGKAKMITPDMIKPGAILIDVGINEVISPNGKSVYVGDIDYDACFDRCAAITPVPGGIGTITTAILLQNLVTAALALY